MRLEGKIAIVTGAGRGLGKAIALRLAEEGCKVVIAEIDMELGEATAETIKASGSDCVAVHTDVADRQSIDQMVKQTIARFSQIDILINNAAIAPMVPFLEISQETLEKVVRTNLLGVFNCSQAVASEMVKKKTGRIVNVSSISAEVSDVGAVPYCAAKGGVKMLTKGIALELAGLGINVNALAPGFIKTDIADGWFDEPLSDTAKWYLSRIPKGEFGVPRDVTGTVVFLCSDDSSYLTGVTILCDGGFMTV